MWLPTGYDFSLLGVTHCSYDVFTSNLLALGSGEILDLSCKRRTALLVLEKPCHDEAHTPHENLSATVESVAMQYEMPVVILSASENVRMPRM